MSSVRQSALQKSTLLRALRRNRPITPDTQNRPPSMDWARLIKPMIIENSPTWSRPNRLVRLRMRGLPVTAPIWGLASRWRTIQARAWESSRASASMQSKNSWRARRAPARRARALPWLLARWTTLSLGCRSVKASSWEPVSSLLPSLMAITSHSGQSSLQALAIVSARVSPSLKQGISTLTGIALGERAPGSCGGLANQRSGHSRVMV